MVGGRRPSMEDDFWWRDNCKARWEADIWYDDCSHKYKINQGVMVGGRQPLV